jgi:hypothetical protein
MPNQDDPQAQSAKDVGTVRNDPESFRDVRNDSEGFGDVRQSAEAFGRLPHSSVQKQSHTLTVREVGRMFEAAGVARTERSVVNWCQLNSQGIARLDAYFDPNERKYFITPQSVEGAIAEEKAKIARNTSLTSLTPLPHDAESLTGQEEAYSEAGSELAKKLEKELMDLKILNSGKDFVIQKLQRERDSFFDQLLDASRKVGKLETMLLQLQGPAGVQSSEETIRERRWGNLQ